MSEPAVVELGPEPDDEQIRACVAAIRNGGKVKPLEGAPEALLHAIVRYANGLLASKGGEEQWQRVMEACDDQPEPSGRDPGERHWQAMLSALTYASEFLLAASLPDPVERLGAIIGVALVTSQEGFATGPETSERLEALALVVRTLVQHPETLAEVVEQLKLWAERVEGEE